MAEIVPLVRGDPYVPFSDDVRARCFVHFATDAARNCAHVERLMAAELEGTDEPIPTRQTIAAWAREDGWHRQADDLMRSTRDWTREQIQVYVFANALLGQRRRHEVLLGIVTDPAQAAMYLKAGELSDRFIERVLPLTAIRPPEHEAADTSELPREEREARARAAVARGTRPSRR
jgi:hypothetical protein